MNPQDSWSEIPPYAFWLLGLAAAGWFIGPWLGYRFALRSQKIQRAETAKQDALAGVSRWQRDMRGLAAVTKAQIIRAQTPGDWFHEYEAAVLELQRMTATVPNGFDTKKRTEVVTAVDQLCSMSSGDGSEAVYGAQKVVDLLGRLEELTNDA